MTAPATIDWLAWERRLHEHTIEIDRPKGSEHPRFPGWIYPLDVGFVSGTVGGDGMEVDVFCGSADNGLNAVLVVCHDGHEEIKLLWNTTADEVAAASDFLAAAMPVEVVWRNR